MLIYGSILRHVTEMPQQFKRVPNEEAMTPLPTPEITPPVTKMYFIFLVYAEILLAFAILFKDFVSKFFCQYFLNF
jgi:hypothetical protein